ncbi:hypothetical protein NW752_006948 [Fusarium irregulare]|uniref:Uncharacterized protein n=1 Tax=Fusarium irregulare TaxID=2494466 RepID=A0A9W8PRP9_9HYPO|nr:hypothetical protein NW766_005830 [Fusarium irregulare]KAJ4016014.1 hypothetical protein NW752_006948 [Fusarium irregulare]
MDYLRRIMPSWQYKRLEPSSPRSDPESLEKSGGPSRCWGMFAKKLLRLPLRTMTILIAVILLVPGLLCLTSLKGRSFFLNGDVVAGSTKPVMNHLVAKDRRLAIVLPANNPAHDLCKVVTSAIALGYPSPVIVNWGKKFDPSKGWKGGSHLAKITGTLEYLDLATKSDTPKENRLEENDIVVLTDSYDCWFQLPPDVLLKRYHEANIQANRRLAAGWKGRGDSPFEQTIIVSAQKKCFPPSSSGSVLHCDELPESPVRKDLYGPKTDRDPNKFHEVRPKFLNSGSMIGPVGDMRRYFRRVQERMQRGLVNGKDLYSDQGVFGEIFAEQEIWRRSLRAHTGVTQDRDFKDLHKEFEYHVGLDYTQQLFIPTVFEEQDGEIITLNDKTAIAEKSKSLNISPRLQGVPDDISKSKNPLSDISARDLDIVEDWGEMPLYADFYSKAIPVVVHHNAHKDGAKKRRYLWWDKIWYFPYLRELLENQLKEVKASSLLEIIVKGERLIYWESRTKKPMKKPQTFVVDMNGTATWERHEFTDVCKSKYDEDEAKERWYDEVFRDGKGEL